MNKLFVSSLIVSLVTPLRKPNGNLFHVARDSLDGARGRYFSRSPCRPDHFAPRDQGAGSCQKDPGSRHTNAWGNRSIGLCLVHLQLRRPAHTSRQDNRRELAKGKGSWPRSRGERIRFCLACLFAISQIARAQTSRLDFTKPRRDDQHSQQVPVARHANQTRRRR
jgi:hypothetical protein